MEPSGWHYAFTVLQSRPCQEVELVINNASTPRKLVPRADPTWFNPDRGLRFLAEFRTLPAQAFSQAVKSGYDKTIQSVFMVYATFRSLALGRVSSENLGGPIMIFDVGYSAAGSGLNVLVLFLGILSVNLAVLNFLPIPPLDGGQMVFLIAEKVRGRPLPDSAVIAGTYFGLFLVLCLMVFVTYQDILHRSPSGGPESRLASREKPRGHERVGRPPRTKGRTMGVLRGRVLLSESPPRLRSSERGLDEIVAACDVKDAAIEPGRPLPWTPIDLVAGLGALALGDDQAPGPSLTQTAPRHPRLGQAIAEPALARWFPGASRSALLALSAGLLQIHDFWDLSHEAAQRADDLGERGSSAYWHGIAHRREPDAGNASYWFRRVGRHSNFTPLAETARHWLDAHDDSPPAQRLIQGGSWNPFAMIDLCTAARPGTAQETLARRLQREEMWLLLETSFAGVVGPQDT